MRVEEFIEQVVVTAQEDPGRAPIIYANAAAKLESLASRQTNPAYAAQLLDIAHKFTQATVTEMSDREEKLVAPVTVSDFDQLLHDTERAYNEVGDDPMELIARRRQIEEERLPPRASFAPASFHHDATLGREAQLTYRPTDEQIKSGIKQSDTVLFVQERKEATQAMTIDINVTGTPFPLGGTIFAVDGPARPYAMIQSGTDGFKSLQVKTDVGLGLRLTVPGSYVTVLVGMAPPGDGGSSGVMTIGASLGLFGASSQAPVTCTAYIDDLAQGTSILVPRPLRAQSLLPVLASDVASVGQSATVSFLSSDGTVVGAFPWTPSTAMNPVAIPNDAYFVRLTRAANPAWPPCNFRLPFQLAL